MIAKSDQFVDTDINEYLSAIGDSDGVIIIMSAKIQVELHQVWRERLCHNGREKGVISTEATDGIYNVKDSDFESMKHMIKYPLNDEFYVVPIYRETVEDGKKIVFKEVGEKR